VGERSGENIMLGGDPKDITKKILSLADVRVDGARPWDMTVHNENFYARVWRLGSLGLGESYMDGWWDCQALDEFFCHVLSAGLERDGAHNWRFAWRFLLASAFNRQTQTRARQVADQHYDLGNQLYQNMLDRRMVYTCARWDHAPGLDEAQEVKLDFVCQKLGLRPGMHLLDIGCGWGSLARFAAQKYGVRVSGITVSREQLQLGQEMCASLPIDLRLQDYRDLGGTFDRIASLGMFEHVGYKNYRTFFEVAHRSLNPGGLFFLSTIGSPRSVRMTDPWIEKYIFPNSHLPSSKQISRAIEGLFATEAWDNWGPDYDRTVMAWFHNFDKNWDKLKSQYDERFYRMWKYYLMASAASFRSRKSLVWQILLSRQ
jgi:cyclopropane-fatty-acyl-phospholipid synthase